MCEISKAFFLFDTNGDGQVSLSEFSRTVRKMQPPLPQGSSLAPDPSGCGQGREPSREQVFALFAAIDADGGRGVDLVSTPPNPQSRKEQTRARTPGH